MIWTHYFLQVNLYLIIFYCFYKLLLQKETYFHFNRIFLFGSSILSLVIPFLRIEWFTKQIATQKIYSGIDQISGAVISIVEKPSNFSFNWNKLILIIYFSGVAIFLFRAILQFLQLKKVINNPKNGHAFSFFNIKKIDAALPSNHIINEHENIHIKQYHSIDIMYFELLSIFFWYNPIVYLYKTAIKNIHEFLADYEAIKLNGDKDAYSVLLLSKVFNVESNLFTNNFYTQSMVKKRIFMLYQERSQKIAVLKYGLFVPLFGFALIISSTTLKRNPKLLDVVNSLPLTVIQKTLPREIKNNAIKWLKETTQTTLLISAHEFDYASNEENNKSVFQESEKILDAFIAKNSHETNAQIMEENIGLNFSEISLKNIITNLENNVALNKSEAQGNISTFNNTTEKSISTPASYTGGLNKISKQIQSQLKYPPAALAANKTGIVVVDFEVDIDGTISNLHINNKQGFGLDEEAMRVVSTLNSWIPKQVNGVPTKSKHNIQIKFELN